MRLVPWHLLQIHKRAGRGDAQLVTTAVPSESSESELGLDSSMSESADEDEETKSQAHWTDCAADPLLAAGHLVLHGLVGVRGLLGASETRTLREFVDVELLRRKGQATAEDNTPECSAACAAFERWFGHVRERRRRYDLKLDIKEPVVLDALHSVCAGLGPILEEVLTADATVVELATMISDPGAAQQAYHPDSLLPSLVGAPLITCFIALQVIATDCH